MRQETFDQLVDRVEVMAKVHPAWYRFYVMGIALLGFLILGVAIALPLVVGALLLGAAFLIVANGGGVLVLIVAKLFKLLILLVIPVIVMIKGSCTLLFSRFPKPQGRALKPAEAPRLFEQIGAIRRQMRGPRIHHVLLTNNLNASIVQHRRLGLLGWEQNYLILGMDLLHILSEAEATAVVAHEYGHLSGHHGRFSGFIYRFRTAWGNLQTLSGQWDDWGSRLVARLFAWYAPYFNAYTFALARQDEYIADRCAAEIAGQRNMSRALLRVNVAMLLEAEKMDPLLEQRVQEEPEPLKNRSAFWTSTLQAGLDPETVRGYLESVLQRKTDHLDTHPALSDRLAALGLAAGEIALERLDGPVVSAAAHWFGPHLHAIQAELDQAWALSITDRWHDRHAYLQQRHGRLLALEAQASPDVDEQWERIELLRELKPETALLPLIDALLEHAPEHVYALFGRGQLLLENGDEAGIESLEKAMQLDRNATLSGCEIAWRFYLERSPEKAQSYQARWQAYFDQIKRVEAELKVLSVNVSIAPAEVDETRLEAIRIILRTHGKYVRRAYLFRRILKSDPTVNAYVLGIETNTFTLDNKIPMTINTLSNQAFPFELFIVHLKVHPYTKFMKSIRRLGITPFYSR